MTMIVFGQLGVLLAASFAVQVMMVMPAAKGAFNGLSALRTPVTVGEPQLSLAMGVPGLIVAVFWPESTNRVMPPGQVITGGVVSGSMVVGSLAVLLAAFESPPPETVAWLVTLAAAVHDTSTVQVRSG